VRGGDPGRWSNAGAAKGEEKPGLIQGSPRLAQMRVILQGVIAFGERGHG
jgi:hypothetical protein